MIRTFEEARRFVLEEKVCTIFGSKKSPYPSLWDQIDLPDRIEGEKGWGEKITAVWQWKNELPATYPEEIFYGKVAGGDAVLMEMEYLRKSHYEQAWKDPSFLPALAQKIYGEIKIEPHYTGELRKLVMEETGCTKSRFDTALKSLQISLNIARSNHPDEVRDQWLLFTEMYPDIAEMD
jgi:hypothetical protein